MIKFKVRKVLYMAVGCFFCFVFSLFKFVVSLFKYLAQATRIRGVAEIRSLSDTYNEITERGKVSFTEYKYVVKIADGDTIYLKKLIEKVSGEGLSKYSVNDRVEVFFDKDNDEVLAVKAVKNDVLIWLVGIGISIVGFIIAFLISAAVA